MKDLAIVALLAVSPGCASRSGTTVPDLDSAGDSQVSSCKVAKDPLQPFIVEWPGTSKTALEVRSQQGVVIVSYVGCYLKVLNGCGADQMYAFTRAAPQRDSFEMSTAGELWTRLPLGAASLKGELATGRRLRLAYVAVGQQIAAAVPDSSLVPAKARPTTCAL